MPKLEMTPACSLLWKVVISGGATVSAQLSVEENLAVPTSFPTGQFLQYDLAEFPAACHLLTLSASFQELPEVSQNQIQFFAPKNSGWMYWKLARWTVWGREWEEEAGRLWCSLSYLFLLVNPSHHHLGNGVTDPSLASHTELWCV